MSHLNLPPADLNIRRHDGKPYVFDRLRRQFVRLTPEEWVRQHMIHYLIHHKHYPEGLLANEVCITLGRVNRRCDTVLYDTFLQPRMIVEYKAPSIDLSQKAFDQILRYSHSLHVPWLLVSNGLSHYCFRVDDRGQVAYHDSLPDWDAL
jgi:hypothetical protein